MLATRLSRLEAGRERQGRPSLEQEAAGASATDGNRDTDLCWLGRSLVHLVFSFLG